MLRGVAASAYFKAGWSFGEDCALPRATEEREGLFFERQALSTSREGAVRQVNPSRRRRTYFPEARFGPVFVLPIWALISKPFLDTN